MIRKKTLSLLAIAVMALSPLTANAETSYYDSNKKTYGITNTKALKKVGKEITSADYKDGSYALNVGVNGGDLTLENNTAPTISLAQEDAKKSIYTVAQNGTLVVHDERYTGEGWALFLKASALSVVPLTGANNNTSWYIADTGKIKYSGVANITQVGSQITDATAGTNPNTSGVPTAIEYANAVPIDEQPIRVAYAYKGEGMGSWELNDVLNKVTIHLDDTIKQDKKNYPNGPTPYQTRFEWTLVSGPGNK